MPSLLFLLHGSGVRPVLPAGANVGAVSSPVLLQRAQLVGGSAGRTADRIHPGGKLLSVYCRLEHRPSASRSISYRPTAPALRPTGRSVLSGRRALRYPLSLSASCSASTPPISPFETIPRSSLYTKRSHGRQSWRSRPPMWPVSSVASSIRAIPVNWTAAFIPGSKEPVSVTTWGQAP